MSIVTISDLHLSNIKNESFNVWKKFLDSKEVASSDSVFLLGDIFDLMIGGKKQYLNYYKWFFDDLYSLIKSGKNVTFIEGNHDFHLEKVFQEFKSVYDIKENLLSYHKDEFTLEVAGKKYLFCHGDLVDYENEGFKKWKSIYRSYYLKTFVNHVLPFKAVIKIGEKASSDSKARNSRSFNYEESKIKYRKGAEKLIKEFSVDTVIAGHTHIIDHYIFEGKEYLNNGFPGKHQSFIQINSLGANLIKLN